MSTKNTSEHFRRIRAFMQKARQDTPIVPTLPDDRTRLLRANLILEEALETIQALGVRIRVDSTLADGTLTSKGLSTHVEPLTVSKDEFFKETVDGCCDVMVVTLGTLISMGIPDVPAMNEVCDSNDSKFRPGYTFRESDGKLIKSPEYTPVDFSKAIKADVLG